MQEWTYCKDKDQWGDGPWQTEPDRVQWQDEETGYWCLIRRNWRIGQLCGYVAIPPDHPYFQKRDSENTESSSDVYMKLTHELLNKYGGYGNVPEGEWPDVLEKHPDYQEELHHLNVHGGVTYTGKSDADEITQKDWLKWRESMIKQLPQAEQYPLGDSAEDWKVHEREINDYELWRKDTQIRSCLLLDVPNAGEYWFIGFDCGHGDDYAPAMEAMLNQVIPGRPERPTIDSPWGRPTYKDLNYVMAECRSLARQLKEIEQNAATRLATGDGNR